jgi:hypothetical protein
VEKKIVADLTLLAKVRAASSPAELCDENGATVAMVVSPEFYREIFSAWAESHLTPEMIAENRRCAAEGRTKTTAEVFARLDALDRSLSSGA